MQFQIDPCAPRVGETASGLSARFSLKPFKQSVVVLNRLVRRCADQSI
jgi:hypothetical protein